jgi:phospholipase D1/2
MKTSQLLATGKNCWKVEQAEKISFLIDGDAYFSAFREALKKARNHIYICAWDIDSKIALVRDDPHDGFPLKLGKTLNAVVENRPDLHIYILLWDFFRLMGGDREWFPPLKLGWETHPNIHFNLDNVLPLGASHHHKFVVIDDALAFAGGLDLTKERWDTPHHRPKNEKRRKPDGNPYRPHHDVQVMLSGAPALSLGRYFRERWELATEKKIKGVEKLQGDTWLDMVDADLKGCRTAIVRTRPQYEDLPGIYEVEQLYLDSIEAAEEYIYIENQYLASAKVIAALKECLQKKNGPEVVIVLPFSTDGWLSQNTMDTLRARAVKILTEADIGNRLAIYYVHLDGLEGEETIKIHSKLMIIDDRFARVGSSNLNNRSMGFDTEVDIAVEIPPGSSQMEAILHFRNQLLAEHLGVEVATVRDAVKQENSLLKAIKALRGNSRTLKKLHLTYDKTVEFIAEEQEFYEPERPFDDEEMAEKWLSAEKVRKKGFRYIQFTVLLVTGIGLALAWRFTPMRELLTQDKLQELVDILKSNDLAWFYVLCAYAAGSLLMIPITVLITLTFLIFGIFQGFFLALLGSAISGALAYWLGRMMGRDLIRALSGQTMERVSRELGKEGIFSTFIIRLVPVAPYSIVNIIAGSTHIRFIDFIVGTILGLLPGMLAIAGVVDRGFAVVRDPSLTTMLTGVGLLAVIIAAFYFIRRKFNKD